MHARNFLVFLGLLFWVPASPAQSIWFRTGAEPQKLPADPLKESAEPRRCFITWARTPILANPSNNDSLLRYSKYLEDNTLTCVADIVPQNGTTFWLLVEPLEPQNITVGAAIRNVVGWVDSRCCKGFLTNHLEGDRDRKTRIHKKCMLINSLTAVRIAADLKKSISFYDRPDAAKRQRAQLPLFHILYVYDEALGHLLLGLEPETPLEANGRTAQERLLGWVPELRVCRWNTREAIEFNKKDIRQRTQGAAIFATRLDLEKYLRLKPTYHQLQQGKFSPPPLALEDLSVKTWPYDQPRFPIVSDEDEQYQGRFFEKLGGYRIWKVGVIGDVYDREGTTIILSGPKLQELKEQAEKLQEQIATVQIIFVINASFGMDRYIEAAHEAVRSILETVQNLGEGNLRPRKVEFSVNFYRDRVDGPRGVFEGHPFTENPSEVLRYLQPYDKITNPAGVIAFGGGTPPDAVFLGLSRSLQDDKGRCKFRPNTTKLLILIGSGRNNPQDKEYTQEKVCQQLLEAGDTSPVTFHAVAVGDQNVKDYALFQEDARQLAHRLHKHHNDWLQKKFAAPDGTIPEALKAAMNQLSGEVFVSTDAREVAGAIRRRFELAMTEIKFKSTQLANLRDGIVPKDLPKADLDFLKNAQAASSYGVLWQQQVMDQIKSQGLDKLVLAREGVQLFNTGWLCERAPLERVPAGRQFPPPTIQHSVLVDKGELRRLAVILDVVLQNWDQKRLEVSWRQALDTITGGEVEIQKARSPADLIRLSLGIQLREGLLGLDFRELSRVDAVRLAKLRRYLTHKRDRIEDILEEQGADYILTQQNGREVWQRRQPHPQRYWWGERNLPRAWIDRELLP